VIGHCKDCRWWDRWGPVKGAPFALGHCHSPHFIQEGVIELPNQITASDQYEQSALITGPDFGCVNFEAEPSND